MKLIGYAFEKTGRVDFSREDNPWAFQRIDSDMKASQKDRIVVDPKQAPVELRSADVNESVPTWMAEVETLMLTAERLILQYKEPGILRFRLATHDAKQHRQFITIGHQDEATLYAAENWQNIRYLFAHRRDIIHFDVTTMITNKLGQGADEKGTSRVELATRMDFVDDEFRITFDSSGYNASTQVVEWRGTVAEGDIGRFAPDNSFITLLLGQVRRPFTFLHEDRQEFRNHSYTFHGDKMEGLLRRVIRQKLKLLEDARVDAQGQEPEPDSDLE